MADIETGVSETTDGDINTVRAIHHCINTASAGTQMAVCSVCGPEVAVRSFKFPSLPPEEIQGAVMLEASQVCPFNVNEGVVDYHLVPDGQKFIQGILVAATKELIDKKNMLVNQASLKNVLMDVDGLAILNCLRECEKEQMGKTLAVLNVGSSYTTLAIIGDDNLPFIRDIAYAGNNIIQKIAAEENIEAENVKQELTDLKGGDLKKSKVYNRLEHAAHELKNDVERVYVCGGFALIEGFTDLLNRKIKADVTLWNPFQKIPCQAGSLSEKLLQQKGPAMVVAAGLAMRTI
jgi:type IV pilus assembly protein PilM